jgi:hypothetical protein
LNSILLFYFARGIDRHYSEVTASKAASCECYEAVKVHYEKLFGIPVPSFKTESGDTAQRMAGPNTPNAQPSIETS